MECTPATVRVSEIWALNVEVLRHCLGLCRSSSRDHCSFPEDDQPLSKHTDRITMRLQELDDDVLIHVFGFVPAHSVLSLRQVVA